MPEGQVLEFKGVTKRFGDLLALSDFSARIEPGAVTGLLGPNGAGKTTTLRILLGQVRATSGTATIGGQSYAELRQPLRTVGSVLEEATYRPRRTASRQLQLNAKANGIPTSRVDEVLDLVGLHGDADTRIGTFSLGMRQRLSVASALLGDPGALVLDEPANGLDPEGIRWMRLLMRRLADEGRTVLVSSHLLSEVEQIADDVVVLAKGRSVYGGSIDALSDPTTGAVIVDAVDRDALTAALAAADVEFDVLRSGVTVRGSDAGAVGAIAAGAGIALTVLQQRGPSLEEVFLDLVYGRRVDATAAVVPSDAPGEGTTSADADAPAGESADAAADADGEAIGATAAVAAAAGAAIPTQPDPDDTDRSVVDDVPVERSGALPVSAAMSDEAPRTDDAAAGPFEDAATGEADAEPTGGEGFEPDAGSEGRDEQTGDTPGSSEPEQNDETADTADAFGTPDEDPGQDADTASESQNEHADDTGAADREPAGDEATVDEATVDETTGTGTGPGENQEHTGARDADASDAEEADDETMSGSGEGAVDAERDGASDAGPPDAEDVSDGFDADDEQRERADGDERVTADAEESGAEDDDEHPDAGSPGDEGAADAEPAGDDAEPVAARGEGERPDDDTPTADSADAGDADRETTAHTDDQPTDSNDAGDDAPDPGQNADAPADGTGSVDGVSTFTAWVPVVVTPGVSEDEDVLDEADLHHAPVDDAWAPVSATSAAVTSDAGASDTGASDDAPTAESDDPRLDTMRQSIASAARAYFEDPAPAYPYGTSSDEATSESADDGEDSDGRADGDDSDGERRD